jgi:hypothetical protein
VFSGLSLAPVEADMKAPVARILIQSEPCLISFRTAFTISS